MANDDLFAQEIAPRKMITRKLELNTPNGKLQFQIHGEGRDIAYINRVADILKRDSLPIFNYLKYTSDTPIHFVLEPRSANPNGSAQVFSFPLIRLNLHPPFGNNHLLMGHDWIRVLVLHELVHILHLNQIDGINKGIKNVFGSLANMIRSLMPNWFVEGLAVWAESYFTRGGRLRNELFIYEAHSRILDQGFCSSIDCLDAPGEYPYRGYAYWVGALFLNFLEDQRPGFIACIIEHHAKRLPFRLSYSFEKCFGRGDLASEFKIFIQQKRHGLVAAREELAQNPILKFPNIRPLKLNRQGVPIFQKDFLLHKGKLLYFIDDKESPQAIHKDIIEGTEQKIDLDYYPHYLSHNNQNNFLLSTSKSGATNGPRQTLWLDIATATKKKFLERPEGMDYPLQAEAGLYFFRYKQDAWNIYLWNGENEKLLVRLPLLLEIGKPVLDRQGNREFISFSSYDRRLEMPYQYWSYSISDHQTWTLFASERPFSFLENCHNKFFLKQKDKLISLERTALDQVRFRWLKLSWLDQLVKIRWDSQDSILLLKDDPTTAYHIPIGCKEFSRSLLYEVEEDRTYSLKKAQFTKLKERPAQGIEEYSPASHLKPHWWQLTYSGGDQTNSWNALTSINDPQERHKFNLELKYYFNLDRAAPQISYLYNFFKNEDYLEPKLDFYASFSSAQTYSRNNISLNQIDQSRTISGALGMKYGKSLLKYIANLGISKTHSQDFIGDQKYIRYSLSQAIWRAPIIRKDKLSHLKLSYTLLNQKAKNHKSYWGHRIAIQNSLQLIRRTFLHGNLAYGKNKKQSLGQGLIYGGGRGGTLGVSFPFYGIANEDAFGNEMFASRLQLETELLRIYRSYKTFPLFFKKINLLAGADLIKTDLIYTQERGLLRKEQMQGMHLGLRQSLTAFYRLPVNIDIISNQIKSKSGFKRSEVLLFINSSLAF